MTYIHVSLLCLALSFRFGIGRNCSKEIKEQCSQRYGIANEINADVFYKVTCETWYELHYCICNSDLTIWYFDLPPYVFTLPDGTLDGILPAILKLVLKSCCRSCTRLSYQKPFKSIADFAAQKYNTTYYQILMPSVAMKEARSHFGNPYVRLIDSPGVIFIQRDNKGAVMLDNLFSSLLATWPLLVVLLFLTIQGGVIIWLLESRSNTDEFPPSFIRGFLEGGWWAYISMTTVGYGDKSPRSFGGRIFAAFWITIGITISGIFTASISSALTSAAFEDKTSIDGKTVGFLKLLAFNYEENIILRDRGKAVGYSNIADLIAAMKNKTIEVILMDRNIFKFHQSLIESSGVELDIREDIVGSDTGFGLSFSSKKHEPWANFIRTFIDENKDAESHIFNDALKEITIKLKGGSHKRAKIGENALGSMNVHKTMLVIMAISCSITVSIGLIVSVAQKLYAAKKRRQRSVKDTEMSADDHGAIADRFDHFSEAVETNVLENLRNQISSLQKDIMNGQKNVRF